MKYCIGRKSMVVNISNFGKSGSGAKVAKRFGFDEQNLSNKIKDFLS